MKKLIIIYLFFIPLFFINEAFCTMPYPSPIAQGNLVEKFSLQHTDKITIKVHFSENYFSAIDKAFDYETSIMDTQDIDIILEGLKEISKVNSYHMEPVGQVIFYSKDKEIFKSELWFFQYSPVFIINKEWYMFYSTNKNNPEQVIYKYMPDEFNKEREWLWKGIEEGKIH